MHEAITGMDMDELLSYLALTLGVMTAILWTVVIIDVLRPRKPRARELRPEPGAAKPRPEERQAELLRELGVDRALASLFYRKLREALDSGEVKPALVSERCPEGTVVFDFVRQGWMCVSRTGEARPLSGNPAGERLEIEDWER